METSYHATLPSHPQEVYEANSIKAVQGPAGATRQHAPAQDKQAFHGTSTYQAELLHSEETRARQHAQVADASCMVADFSASWRCASHCQAQVPVLWT